MARWTGHTLIGRHQWRILRNRVEGKPDPRQQMLNDLAITIEALTNKQFEIILMWDANEGLTTPKSKLHQFMRTTNLHHVQ
jgi:hypothetical protein